MKRLLLLWRPPLHYVFFRTKSPAFEFAPSLLPPESTDDPASLELPSQRFPLLPHGHCDASGDAKRVFPCLSQRLALSCGIFSSRCVFPASLGLSTDFSKRGVHTPCLSDQPPAHVSFQVLRFFEFPLYYTWQVPGTDPWIHRSPSSHIGFPRKRKGRTFPP